MSGIFWRLKKFRQLVIDPHTQVFLKFIATETAGICFVQNFICGSSPNSLIFLANWFQMVIVAGLKVF